MSSHLRLIQIARRWPLLVGLAVGLGFLGGLLVVAQARLLSAFLSRTFLDSLGLQQTGALLRALAAVVVLRAAVQFGSDFASIRLAACICDRLRRCLYDHLLELGIPLIRQRQTGDLTAVLTQGIETLEPYFSQYLPQAVLAALIPLLVMASVFPLDALSGLILLLTAPLLPVFMILIGRTSEMLTRRQWGALSRMSATFLDAIQGLTALKELGRSQGRAAGISEASRRYRSTTLGVLRVTFLSAFALEFIGTLSTAIVAVQIGLRLLYGRMDFEQAFFILVITPEMYLPLRQLGLRFHAGMAGVTAAQKIFELLDTPAQSIPNQPSAFTLPASYGSSQPDIRFEKVSFTYPGREQPALDNISFNLEPGCLNALAGPSGSGKSTLAALLLGFMEPTSGCISVNGIPLSAISREEWRSRLAWVPQTPHLFQDTLAANLSLSRPDAGMEDMLNALRMARLEEFVLTLPQGLQTPIGERGERLSGGQLQRLALARAYLKNTPLLILDEPTSHLDPEEEALVQMSMQTLIEGRTVLIIAHRFSTLQKARQVLVLEGGRLGECAAPGSLKDPPGLFQRLAEARDCV